MLDPAQLLKKAKTSSFYLWILNQVLDRIIPFNKPHGFRILEIGEHDIKTFLPYRRRNKNHIGGMHACAMATLSEFTTGVLLLNSLDLKKYRLILKTLEVDYHYQGRMDAYAHFGMTPEMLEEKVFNPLQSEDSVTLPCEINIHDRQGNHLTTARVFWQIKEWEKVRSRNRKNTQTA